jgi:hypothetical protein
MIEEILLADVCVVAVKRSPYSVWFTPTRCTVLALERPVLASRLDSVAACAPADAILYFEPGDSRDLAEKLTWALTHPDEMAQRVRVADTKYDALRWERAKQGYLARYREFS